MTDTRFLGVDTGGTFTDFVYFDGHNVAVHKVLSTPDDPQKAILQGIAELGLDVHGLKLVHGSTVATNAVLEGKGVRTAYITNHGLADVLTIGRQTRDKLYELQPQLRSPPVPAELCLETGGRIAADGSIVDPLTTGDLEQLRAQLQHQLPQAVAINLLFSFVDDSFEKQIEEQVPLGVFVSRSSQVLSEYREYERGIATWLNAYVGPIMQAYLAGLQRALPATWVTVMQSHGATISARQAGNQAVRLLLSGPAGGLMGARYVARAAGCQHVLSFDMGGTSTDVALIQDQVQLTTEGRIGGYPLAIPMVDMHTIGAGGGSIASVDAGGLLQVGPQSAGAEPGPACYARGGQLPTVTDAHVVLGHIPKRTRLAAHMLLNHAAALVAVTQLGEQLNLTPQQAALGIIRVANEHMAQALREISVQRGVDPRAHTLVSFGGAGGLHVCELAHAMHIRRALVPVRAGVLSALGMIVAPQGVQLSHSLCGELGGFQEADINAAFDSLIARGTQELKAQGLEEAIIQTCSVDLRYLGQSSTLEVGWHNIAECERMFHMRHTERFGHKLDMPVELVNLRVALMAHISPPQLPEWPLQEPSEPLFRQTLYATGEQAAVYERDKLAQGQVIDGPAVVTEAVATTLISQGWRGKVDSVGNIILELGG